VPVEPEMTILAVFLLTEAGKKTVLPTATGDPIPI
jgi:hypothetical protein